MKPSLPLVLSLLALSLLAAPASARAAEDICSCRQNALIPKSGDIRFPMDSATLVYSKGGKTVDIFEFQATTNPGRYRKVRNAIDRCRKALDCCLNTPRENVKAGQPETENIKSCAAAKAGEMSGG